ncbi:hypothetical protein LTR78_004916 [Recurvomyces mirabilis]|uniref:Uncharacterized protein n=1 Tax=Recurvomyces mirabilis TaxID=574656 RepID=A0AAE0WPH4_9PEZI|nr:hypothetical protein LTR78_004916 [Recurvomyces mirabilis]KAK5158086.1 hypothetical protein LTS14_004009 [Recurvomyces mirabilis]
MKMGTLSNITGLTSYGHQLTGHVTNQNTVHSSDDKIKVVHSIGIPATHEGEVAPGMEHSPGPLPDDLASAEVLPEDDFELKRERLEVSGWGTPTAT